jgi:hypothetical protein
MPQVAAAAAVGQRAASADAAAGPPLPDSPAQDFWRLQQADLKLRTAAAFTAVQHAAAADTAAGPHLPGSPAEKFWQVHQEARQRRTAAAAAAVAAEKHEVAAVRMQETGAIQPLGLRQPPAGLPLDLWATNLTFTGMMTAEDPGVCRLLLDAEFQAAIAIFPVRHMRPSTGTIRKTVSILQTWRPTLQLHLHKEPAQSGVQHRVHNARTRHWIGHSSQACLGQR